MKEETKQHRVAIIGGGVSGLSAAWHLHTQTSDKYDVTIFESKSKLGGHAHTISIDDGKEKVDVDVGFMVFNHENYPNMTKWFDEIGVKEENTDMSLSVSLDGGNTIEWSSAGLAGLTANKRQLLSPSFYTFLKDMHHFNTQAAKVLLLPDDDPRKHVTTRQYLKQEGYSDAFAAYYLLPMMAALWSASMEDVLSFPAVQLVGFMCNHKMLQIFDRPQYKTVAGRSQKYTTKIQSLLGEKHIHLSTPIFSIQKQSDTTYELFSTNDKSVGKYDEIIFACHPPIAASILSKSKGFDDDNAKDLSSLISCLENIEYADNVIYVHSDPTLMPKSKDAWSSWNCIGKSDVILSHVTGGDDRKQLKRRESMEGGESGFGAKKKKPVAEGEKNEEAATEGAALLKGQSLEGADGRMKAVYVTYYLNKLQNLKTETDIFVSLNPHTAPSSDKTFERLIMAHPQFTNKAVYSRNVLEREYQGKEGLWFAGAWSGYGFHEDGCRSGFDVVTKMSSVALPWAVAAKEETKQKDDDDKIMVLPPPNLAVSQINANSSSFLLVKIIKAMYNVITESLPITICRPIIVSFLQKAIVKGQLRLKFNDGSVISCGDASLPCGSTCGGDDEPVTVRVFDEWFFVKVALEYDLGLARSYMAGHFVVEPLPKSNQYDPIIRPSNLPDETNAILGDPVGLTRLFLLFIGNRDNNARPLKSARAHSYSNAFTNASGLLISKVGSFLNFLRYKLTMDNSERGGSLENIHAHYDLSNDLFTSFLDKETLMYSSAIYDAVVAPHPTSGPGNLVFRGTLEEAQVRKLDTLLSRAQIRPGQKMLDIGFGWGGLTIHAAKKYGCHVTGITLSVEQKALAEERVKKEGVEHLVTFEVIDYRTFCRRKENCGKFDRVLSCEMIEAVGHEHLGEFYWAVEQVLAYDGILVMEAITTPEARYETYRRRVKILFMQYNLTYFPEIITHIHFYWTFLGLFNTHICCTSTPHHRSTDFINTIIFPGGCCPSLHALIDASYKESTLTLEHIDNIGLHYARTLAEWRRRFNANESTVRSLGFDDIFMRVWNYYLTYCEAGFQSQTENCLILVFSRPGCRSLVPLCESREITQSIALTDVEMKEWLKE